ncbi:MAG: outer membrane protein assembly factor BamC [Proteobacteria bacterium]|nr:outer membrane protein assembly factor BamC [Burkholderiales bacterium]
MFGGCQTVSGLLEGRRADYRKSGRLPPLEVPPDLTRPQADTRFNVPDIGGPGSATYSDFDRQRQVKPKPGDTGLLPQVEKTRIERAGNERWLIVPGTPEKVWPLVRDFWIEAGYLISLETPEAGVMETDWAENRPRVQEGGLRGLFDSILTSVRSTGTRDRFRTRLERTDDGSTEVYVSHRGLEEVQVGLNSPQFIWQPRKADPDLEAEMLRRIMVRFGAPEAVAKAGIAQPVAARASIAKGTDGVPNLSVLDDFDRAWRRVGLALDRVGFTVEDRDRSKGLYFVRYADTDALQPKGTPSALSRLAFWRGDGSGAKKAEQFRILVDNGERGSRVQVLNRDGGADRSETAQRILTVLLEQLR